MFVMFVIVNVFIINKGSSSSSSSSSSTAEVAVGICANISLLWETMSS